MDKTLTWNAPSGRGTATTFDWIARIATRRRAKGDVKRAMVEFLKNSEKSEEA